MRSEIKSEKILVKDIFTNMWFRIPEYQRPYVWGYDEIHELLDDLSFAIQNKADSDYFLGSFVFQSKKADPNKGQKFDENDLLDGQQRMTTLLLIFAVIRDLSNDEEAKDDCQKCIYQKPSKYKKIPERTRLVFGIREAVQKFIEDYVKEKDGTSRKPELNELIEKSNNVSVKNMAKAILEIRKFFDKKDVEPELFLQFLLNNVLFIYVATENMEDAFRLFMILNDRGVPLRNSDILKSINLGALEIESEKIKYAKLWEEAEGELAEDFDRFLNHLRAVLVKEKARLNLLQEFEDKIYNPKEKDKSTGKLKLPLLSKGKDTFVFIEKYLKHYRTLLSGNNYEITDSFAFDNLLKVMLKGLPATDWIPPLLHYYDKFGEKDLYKFLVALDRKFSADWISQYTPTYRIESMNDINKVIASKTSVVDIFNSSCFVIDDKSFMRVLQDDIYGRRFARYILLKLDYFYQNHQQRMHFETLSVEHILPQTPKDDSQWVVDFTETQREIMTHKFGNLVLITRRKNSSQGRLDYKDKKERYFQKNIDTCPNSIRILNKYNYWTPIEFDKNQTEVLDLVKTKYAIT
ncbi:MAG TPA: DUF262 domain-containing protein [Bacteroidia bacterium]|nr:DUF262 domain-containing protein [Bacteroidia bacterium]